MKYTLYLSNGIKIEHADRPWWQSWWEGWGWRNFRIDGKLLEVRNSSIVYMEQEKSEKLVLRPR